ncbi:alpha-scruin-like protein, partial [Leptotrombidium deliense]
ILDSVETYNETNRVWQLTASMDCARYGMATVTCADYIYVVGGVTEVNGEKKLLNSVICYNNKENRWLRLPEDYPFCCAFMTAVEHDGCIYVCGGITNLHSCTVTSSVYVYDPEKLTWFEQQSLNVPRSHATGHRLYNRVYVFGGCGTNGERKHTNERLVSKELGWLEETLLPIPVSGQRIVCI